MNYLHNKKITYIFGDGRKDKLLSNKVFAKEFFYSYFEFINKSKKKDNWLAKAKSSNAIQEL